MLKGNTVIAGLGAAAALLGGLFLLRLNRLSNELETVVTGAIHKVSLSGLDLQIDVTVKNPTEGTVKIKYPFVKLVYNNKTIASSVVRNDTITIPKYGQVKLDPIKINFGFLYLATVVPGLLKDYHTTGNISVEARTVTTINDTLPYSKSQMLVIGGGIGS